jgi:peptide/nickel transport system permease protein
MTRLEIALGLGRTSRSLGRASRVLSRLPRTAIVGGVITGAIVAAVVLAPILPLQSPDASDFTAILSPPSFLHPFGTDETGRDILSRTIFALRLDLLVVLFVTYVPLPIGVVIGALAGYFRGPLDGIFSRLADVMIAFPFIVLVIAVVAIIGPGIAAVLVGVPLVAWALYARLARSEMLLIRELPYMEATTALGYSRMRSVFRHAIPNLIRSALVYSTIDLLSNLLVLAGLSYLGLGAQAPQPELGSMIAEGQGYLLTAWWVTTLPGLVMVLFGIGVGLLGDGLSDGRMGKATK